MWFDVLVFAAAASGGAVAAVAGFGIGSLLTPVLALQVDARLAVAAVAIPHAAGTGLRLWLLGGHVDRRVLQTFGLTSAAGGLAGAVLHAWAGTPAVMLIFGALLLFTAGAELTGWGQRMRFEGAMAAVAGATSGLLGGLVGNQGGIRSAAMLGTTLSKDAFVGTATAVALMVDAARLPVYLWTHYEALAGLASAVAIGTAGVVGGTFLGMRVLRWIPERSFRRTVAVLVAVLGAAMIAGAMEEQ